MLHDSRSWRVRPVASSVLTAPEHCPGLPRIHIGRGAFSDRLRR